MPLGPTLGLGIADSFTVGSIGSFEVGSGRCASRVVGTFGIDSEAAPVGAIGGFASGRMPLPRPGGAFAATGTGIAGAVGWVGSAAGFRGNAPGRGGSALGLFGKLGGRGAFGVAAGMAIAGFGANGMV